MRARRVYEEHNEPKLPPTLANACALCKQNKQKSTPNTNPARATMPAATPSAEHCARTQAIYKLALDDAAVDAPTKQALRAAALAMVRSRHASMKTLEDDWANAEDKRSDAEKRAAHEARLVGVMNAFEAGVRGALPNFDALAAPAERRARADAKPGAQHAQWLNESAGLLGPLGRTGDQADVAQQQTVLAIAEIASDARPSLTQSEPQSFVQLLTDWEDEKNRVKRSVALFKDAHGILIGKIAKTRIAHHAARRAALRAREEERDRLAVAGDRDGLEAMDAKEAEAKRLEEKARFAGLVALEARHPHMGNYGQRAKVRLAATDAAAAAAKAAKRAAAAALEAVRVSLPEREADWFAELLEKTSKTQDAPGRVRYGRDWKSTRPSSVHPFGREFGPRFVSPAMVREAEAASAAVYAQQAQFDEEDVFRVEAASLGMPMDTVEASDSSRESSPEITASPRAPRVRA